MTVLGQKKAKCLLLFLRKKRTNIDSTYRVVSKRASIAVNMHLTEETFVLSQ